MLVKVRDNDSSRLSATERIVVDWLLTWRGSRALTGMASIGPRGADMIVWTPKLCVLVLIRGLTERLVGTLSCTQDQPWTVDGKPAPVEAGENGAGTKPLDDIVDRADEIEQQLRAVPQLADTSITGVVLVVPQLGSRLKIAKGELPHRTDVILGDGPSSLRNYINRVTSGSPDTWDAGRVEQAMAALGIRPAVTFSELVAEGFPTTCAVQPPDPTTKNTGTQSRRAAARKSPAHSTAANGAPAGDNPAHQSSTPAEASPAVALAGNHAGAAPIPAPLGSSSVRSSSSFGSGDIAAARSSDPLSFSTSGQAPPFRLRTIDRSIPQPYAVPFERPARTPNRLGAFVPIAAILACLVVVLSVVSMCGPDNHNARGGGTPSHSSVAPAPPAAPVSSVSPAPTTIASEPPPPPPNPAPPPPAPPAAAPAPPRARPTTVEPIIPPDVPDAACYPFQPDC